MKQVLFKLYHLPHKLHLGRKRWCYVLNPLKLVFIWKQCPRFHTVLEFIIFPSIHNEHGSLWGNLDSRFPPPPPPNMSVMANRSEGLAGLSASPCSRTCGFLFSFEIEFEHWEAVTALTGLLSSRVCFCYFYWQIRESLSGPAISLCLRDPMKVTTTIHFAGQTIQTLPTMEKMKGDHITLAPPVPALSSFSLLQSGIIVHSVNREHFSNASFWKKEHVLNFLGI